MSDQNVPLPAEPDSQPTAPEPVKAASRARPEYPRGGDATLRWKPWIKRILITCIVFEIVWIILDQTISVYKWIDDSSIRHIFRLTLEENAPTWFSSTQATFVALTIFAIYFVSRSQGVSKWTRWGWLVLAFFFAYLGMDDAAKIHERVGSAIGRAFQRNPDSQNALVQGLLSIETYNWQRFLGPIFGMFGIFLVVFLWRHFGRYGLRRYFISGLVCWVIAVGIDFVEGIDDFFEDLARSWNMDDDFVEHNFKVIEEILEMVGFTLFWQGFLRYLAHISDGFKLRMRPD